MRTYLSLVFIAFAGLCAVFSLLSDVFLSWPNILNVFTASAVIGILAVGATFVIAAGGIDLSVGSLMALSAVTGIAVTGSASPLALILAACLLTGAAGGALNGVLIGKLKLPAFIVTLGMLSFARGLALILSEGHPVYGLPPSLLFLGQGRIATIPVPILLFLAVAAFGHILLNVMPFGRHCLTIGDNEDASRTAGIRIIRHKILLYAFSGLLAALAGVVSMARVNAADPAAGMMYELTAITAAIIGGAALSGGRASVLGAMLGALFISVLQNGMTLMNMPAYYQQVGIGFVLIAAVAFGRIRRIHIAAD